MRAFLGVLMALVSTLTFGAVAIEIQTGGTPLPTYWSGTSCRLDVFAYSLPIQEPGEGPGWTEPTIDEAWMWLRGYENPNDPQEETTTQEIFHWKRRMTPRPGPFNFSVGQRIMFDSSQFKHGSRVEIHVKIIENGGAVTEARDSTTVYNVAGVFSHRHAHETHRPDLPNPVTAAVEIRPVLMQNNYYVPFFEVGISGVPTTTWNTGQLLNAHSQCTLLYVDTHGGSGIGGSNFSHIWDNNNATLCALPGSPFPDMLTASQSKVGTGTPPFQNGLPPTWISYIDACSVSNNNQFAEATLWPYLNYYGGWTENQATIGWNGDSAWYSKSHHAIEMYHMMLLDRLDVDVARNDGGSTPRVSYLGTMVVHGDYFARLKGAYYPFVNPNGTRKLLDNDGDLVHDWWYAY